MSDEQITLKTTLTEAEIKRELHGHWTKFEERIRRQMGDEAWERLYYQVKWKHGLTRSTESDDLWESIVSEAFYNEFVFPYEVGKGSDRLMAADMGEDNSDYYNAAVRKAMQTKLEPSS